MLAYYATGSGTRRGSTLPHPTNSMSCCDRPIDQSINRADPDSIAGATKKRDDPITQPNAKISRIKIAKELSTSARILPLITYLFLPFTFLYYNSCYNFHDYSFALNELQYLQLNCTLQTDYHK